MQNIQRFQIPYLCSVEEMNLAEDQYQTVEELSLTWIVAEDEIKGTLEKGLVPETDVLSGGKIIYRFIFRQFLEGKMLYILYIVCNISKLLQYYFVV